MWLQMWVPDVGLPWWTALILMVSIFVSPSSIRESHLNLDTNAYHLGIMTYFQPVFIALGDISRKLKAFCRGSVKIKGSHQPFSSPDFIAVPINTFCGTFWSDKEKTVGWRSPGGGKEQLRWRKGGRRLTNKLCHQRKLYLTIFLGGVQQALCKAYPTCSPYRHLISRFQDMIQSD